MERKAQREKCRNCNSRVEKLVTRMCESLYGDVQGSKHTPVDVLEQQLQTRQGVSKAPITHGVLELSAHWADSEDHCSVPFEER